MPPFSALKKPKSLRMAAALLPLSAMAQQAPAPARRALFRCWYSNGDNAVYPPAAATLAGADNRFVASLAHVELAFDPRVLADCLELIKLGSDSN